MDKIGFLSILSDGLSRLPHHERNEIISEYDQHFMMGIANGKTEHQISVGLGDPQEIAEQYMEEFRKYSRGSDAHINQKATRSIEDMVAKMHGTNQVSYNAKEDVKTKEKKEKKQDEKSGKGFFWFLWKLTSAVVKAFLAVLVLALTIALLAAGFGISAAGIGVAIGGIMLLAGVGLQISAGLVGVALLLLGIAIVIAMFSKGFLLFGKSIKFIFQ